MGQDLWTALQPIIDGETGYVVAHEALLRGAVGTPWESPTALFSEATRLGQRHILEANARRLALDRLADLPERQYLFMNVDAHSPDIPVTTALENLPTHRIVLELSEREPVLNNPILLAQVAQWRDAGHPIALDDYGAGYMGPGAILTLKPDILKLDRELIAGIDQDPWKTHIVAAIMHLSQTLHMAVIAEGVETPEEFLALRAIGLRYIQGFLLGRPQVEPLRHRVAIPRIHPRLVPYTGTPLPGRRLATIER
ncbi:MAG: EAL domain-containing protein [Sulfobacillus sp.]